MSIKTGVAATVSAASTAVFIYFTLAIVTNRIYLLDVGYVIESIKPYYWAGTGEIFL